MFTKSSYTNYTKYKEEIKYSNDLPIKLGDFVINLLTQFPHDLFERKFNPSSFYSRESVALNINPLYLDDIRNNIIVNPYTLPMLCKPNLWSENSYGGYLENKTREISIITGASTHDHKIENTNSLYKAINYLNSIKFRVNNLLLDYLIGEGKFLLETIDPENKVHREITLKIAKLFSRVPFYLNVNADWRGRVYTQSFFISYQGGDLSSALLNFCLSRR
jgi:DNA-directed RNA polymerase